MKCEFFAACAGVVAVMAGGWSASAAPPELVQQGKINSIVLSKDDVSSIIGVTITIDQAWSTPAPPNDGVDPSECTALFGLTSHTVGDDWDAFELAVRKDGDSSGFDHIVVQDVGIYGDADTPAKLFHDAFQSVGGCNGILHFSNSNGTIVDWQVKGTPTVTSNQAQWSMSQLSDGKPNGWRCAYDTRVQSNVLLDAVVCQYGNPVGVTKRIADRMTAAVSA